MGLEKIIGKEFNNWKILSYSHFKIYEYKNKNSGKYYKNKIHFFNAICKCGTKRLVSSNSVVSGNSKSCGCMKKYYLRKHFTTHGDGRERLYGIWKNMKDRCYNPNSKPYKNYGGRGILVCDKWLNSYENFKEWSLNNGYSIDLTIDRIDNNKNYSPKNCRWIDMTAQQNNQRRNVVIHFEGENKTAAQWARELNVNPDTLRQRKKAGWSDEAIIKTPIRKSLN